MKTRKNNAVLLNAVLICALVALIGLVVWQYKINQQLSNSLRDVTEQLSEAKRVNARKVELKRKARAYDREESAQLKVIPLRETRPLDLFKTLFQIAGQKGQADVSIALVQEKKDAAALNSPAGAGQPAVETVVLPPKVQAVKFSMKSKSAYADLERLLWELMSMERLVSITGLSIERSKGSFPLQDVKMDIMAYTFTEE